MRPVTESTSGKDRHFTVPKVQGVERSREDARGRKVRL